MKRPQNCISDINAAFNFDLKEDTSLDISPFRSKPSPFCV